MKSLAIVGGGLTGLTVAFRRACAGDRVTLFEASSRLGGQLWTTPEDGWIVELGAEGFVARSDVYPSGARWSNFDDVKVQARKPSNGSPTTKPVPSSG